MGKVVPRRYTNGQRVHGKEPMSVLREVYKTIPSATMWQGQNNNSKRQGEFRKVWKFLSCLSIVTTCLRCAKLVDIEEEWKKCSHTDMCTHMYCSFLVLDVFSISVFWDHYVAQAGLQLTILGAGVTGVHHHAQPSVPSCNFPCDVCLHFHRTSSHIPSL